MSITLLRNPHLTIKDTLFFYRGEMVVLETEDDAYVGVLQILNNRTVTVRTGLTGRPPIINIDDIMDVISASAHPDVEVL